MPRRQIIPVMTVIPIILAIPQAASGWSTAPHALTKSGPLNIGSRWASVCNKPDMPWYCRRATHMKRSARSCSRKPCRVQLANSVGVIGVDSGLSHIAVALDLPHVQIYNFDTAWRTGPIDTPHQQAVFAKPAPSVDAVWQCWQACQQAHAQALGGVA